MKSGPVAQLRPMANRSRCATDTYRASIDCPASIVPIVSMETDSTTGTDRPARAKPSSMPTRAAFTLRVSCCVSRKRTSTPPSSSPSVCSANAAVTWSNVTPPVTEMVFVPGPMEPATKRGRSCVSKRAHASRAIRAAATLMSRTRSWSPYSASTILVPPKVSVSTRSAPASR
jgi:hypothetical protein